MTFVEANTRGERGLWTRGLYSKIHILKEKEKYL